MRKMGLVLVMVTALFAQKDRVAFKVKTVTLEKKSISEYVHAYGKVVTGKMGYVFSPMPGKLIRYTKKQGSFFKKDEVVAYVDRNIPGVKTKPLLIKAPFDGILAITYAHEGDMVAQTKPVALFYTKDMYIEIDATSDIISRIKTGEECILGSKGKRGKGIVESVSFGVDPMAAMGKIKIKVVKGRKLIPGDVVSVSIAVRKADGVFVVPLESVVEREGKYYVFAYEGGKAKKIPIKLGIVSGNMAEIESGELKEGERIVTLGAAGLYDGAPVEVEK